MENTLLVFLVVYVLFLFFVLRKPKAVRERHDAAAKFEQSIMAKGQQAARDAQSKG